MKFTVGITLAAFATAAASVSAGPGRMNVGKRDTTLSTEQEAVLPENKPIERNEVVGDKRFEAGAVPKKSAIVGERRSAITVTEGREKRMFVTPDRKDYKVIERKESPWAGKQSRFSTGEDAYRSKVATRFQDKIGEASPFAGDTTPVVSKRTTFDRVNRFAFRKNGDQAVTATPAGSGQAPADISQSSSALPSGVSVGPPVSSATTSGAGAAPAR